MHGLLARPMHLYFEGSPDDPLFLNSILKRVLVRFSGMHSLSQMNFTSSSFTVGQCLYTLARMPSGPVALFEFRFLL